MRDPARREKGAVAVEFALTMMVLIPLVLGGIHLGLVLGIRHRINDAAGYATRAAAIARTTDSTVIRNMVVNRFGSTSDECTSILVNSSVIGASPYRRLEVRVTCNLPPPFGAVFLPGVGPDKVTATAAMPYP
jgi:Flp pilus assembly protein TadG